MEENTSQKPDYYAGDIKKKLSDFILGFFLMPILSIIVILLIGSYAYFSEYLIALFVLLVLAGIVFLFAKGRRYIGIGIVSFLIIPLLVFGACVIAFSGAGGW